MTLGAESADAAEHHHHGQHAADTLTQEGSPCHTGNAHLKTGHEQDIHADVGQRRDRKEVEGGLAIAKGRENAGGNVVEEHEGQTQNVDVQIQRRVRKDLLRGIDELQQGIAAQQTNAHQHGAQHRRADEGGVDRGLHLAVFLCAEAAGHDDRAADVAAKGKGDKDQGDLVAVAHRSQRVLTDELARHQTVGDVVQLLENDAAEHGQTELPQYL